MPRETVCCLRINVQKTWKVDEWFKEVRRLTEYAYNIASLSKAWVEDPFFTHSLLFIETKMADRIDSKKKSPNFFHGKKTYVKLSIGFFAPGLVHRIGELICQWPVDKCRPKVAKYREWSFPPLISFNQEIRIVGYNSLRIQICPKKGINPTILLWGWDWDHQTYSREGYGSLGIGILIILNL